MDKLYKINNNLVDPNDTGTYATPVDTENDAFAIPQRVYSLIVPEKPAILAEERIFVYVPKVAYDVAGIAKFAPTQFNILNGQVSLNQSYFAEMIIAAANNVGRGIFFPDDLPLVEERYVNLVFFDTDN